MSRLLLNTRVMSSNNPARKFYLAARLLKFPQTFLPSIARRDAACLYLVHGVYMIRRVSCGKHRQLSDHMRASRRLWGPTRIAALQVVFAPTDC